MNGIQIDSIQFDIHFDFIVCQVPMFWKWGPVFPSQGSRMDEQRCSAPNIFQNTGSRSGQQSSLGSNLNDCKDKPRERSASFSPIPDTQQVRHVPLPLIWIKLSNPWFDVEKFSHTNVIFYFSDDRWARQLLCRDGSCPTWTHGRPAMYFDAEQ